MYCPRVTTSTPASRSSSSAATTGSSTCPLYLDGRSLFGEVEVVSAFAANEEAEAKAEAEADGE